MDSNWVSAALTVLRWAAFIICFWLVQLKHTTGSWSSFVEMSKSIPTLITRSRGWVESGRRAASRSAQSQSQLELRVCSRLHLSLTFLSPTLLIVLLVSWLIVQSIKNPRILKNIHHISSESDVFRWPRTVQRCSAHTFISQETTSRFICWLKSSHDRCPIQVLGLVFTL